MSPMQLDLEPMAQWHAHGPGSLSGQDAVAVHCKRALGTVLKIRTAGKPAVQAGARAALTAGSQTSP